MKNRLQFSLTDLLVFMIACAVGFGVWHARYMPEDLAYVMPMFRALTINRVIIAPLAHAMLCIAAVFCAAGLWQEAQTLFRMKPSNGEDDAADRRFGHSLAILIRISLLAMVLIFLVGETAFLPTWRRDILAAQPDVSVYLVGLETLFICLILTLACSLGARQSDLAQPRRPRTTSYLLVGLACGALLFLSMLHDVSMFPFFYHIACQDSERALSAVHHPGTDIRNAYDHFIRLVLLPTACIPLGVFALWQSGRASQATKRRKIGWLITIALSIAINLFFTIQVLPRTFAQTAPYLAQAFELPPWQMIAIGLAMTAILTTAFTYRSVLDNPDRTTNRRNQPADASARACRLYHRKPIVLCWILFAILTRMVGEIWQGVSFGIGFETSATWSQVLEAIAGYFYYIPHLFITTLAIVASRNLWHYRRHGRDDTVTIPPAVPPGRFLAVWSLSLALLLASLPTLTAFSFALWIAPWNR